MKNIELPLVGGGVVSVPETSINSYVIDHLLARNQELMSAPKPDNQRAETVRSLENLVERFKAVAIRANEALQNYERMGEVCPFEGQPMIYAETLVEIGELARAALSAETVQKLVGVGNV